MVKNSFGQKLKQAIKAKRLTQEALAELAGINEKHISKKWRYMLVQDAVNKVCELLDNVVASNSVYPNTAATLQLRTTYLQAAAINAYQLENKFQCMVRVIETVKIKDLENVMSLLFDEVNLLKGAYQNAKLVK